VTYELRLAVIGLAAFAAAGLLGAAAVPWLARRIRLADPASRASVLERLRIFPAAAGIAAGALSVTSYLIFEPRHDEEKAGVILLALASLAAGLMILALGRWWHVARVTRRTLRHWLETSRPIALAGAGVPAYEVAAAFPIVAVVGVRRPRLIIARSVLESCPAEELAAILAHEQSHLKRRDNLRRALLVLTPDVLGWLPISRRLVTDWHEASEELADDFAGASDPARRLTLARALIRVARLAPAGASAACLPASALYRGESVDRRVRRLLAPPSIDRPAPPAAWRRPVLGFLTVAACTLALGGVQAIVEAAVNLLP
jgi:Zn-dependent protease with chaperone function